MSDQNIDQLRHTLKQLNARIEKLGRAVERLEMLAYHYHRLAMEYKKLSIQCAELTEILDHIDVAAFEVRQDYTFLKETYERVKTEHLRH